MEADNKFNLNLKEEGGDKAISAGKLFQKGTTLRGHVQTITGKINVIVTLGGRGVQGVTLRIAAEGKTVSKQGKFVSNHDVKSGGEGDLSLTSQ